MHDEPAHAASVARLTLMLAAQGKCLVTSLKIGFEAVGVATLVIICGKAAPCNAGGENVLERIFWLQ